MKTIFTLAATFFALFSFSQNTPINWQKAIGGNSLDIVSKTLKSPDGNGYYVFGQSESNASGDKTEDSQGGSDVWFAKLNNQGNIEWDKTIGGEQDDGGTLNGGVMDALFLDNEIFMLVRSRSPISGDKTSPLRGFSDYWLICTDLEGDIIWDESYGGDDLEIPHSIDVLNNGNLLLSGISISGISGNKTDETNGLRDYWILEVEPEAGEIIQQRSVGSSENDFLRDAAIAEDGSIYLAGFAFFGESGDKTDPGNGGTDCWIVKLDEEFNIIQDKCFGGITDEGLYAELQFKNGFLHYFDSSNSIASGNKTTQPFGNQDYWYLKLDPDLNIQAEAGFGGSGNDIALSFLIKEEKIVLSGVTDSPVSGTLDTELYGDTDSWLVFMNSDGEEIGQAVLGGSNADPGGHLLELDGNNILLTKYSNSNLSGIKTVESRGSYDYWLLQIDASVFLSVEDSYKSDVELKTYPNPFTNQITFDLAELTGPSQLRIFSAEGKLIFSEEVSGNQFTWQPEEVSGSFYFYELRNEDQVYRGKLIRN